MQNYKNKGENEDKSRLISVRPTMAVCATKSTLTKPSVST